MKSVTCTCCGKVFLVEEHQSVLSCQQNFTPYKKKDQTTTVVSHTHGVGRPGRLEWVS